MFTVKGKIVFDPKDMTRKHAAQSDWKRSAIVLLDCDTHLYYMWLLERRFGLKLNRPLRGTHFTIINDRVNTKERTESFERAKEKWDGKEVEFTYKPDYRTDDKHFWFRVHSDDAIQIRTDAELGKPHWGFHLTVGLVSEKYQEDCAYIHRMMLKFPKNC
jgi:hypothetical protein